MNKHENICPKCHSPIPPDAPGGLCPGCVMARVRSVADQAPAADPDIPSCEQLAAIFPQLEILEFIGRGGMGFVFKSRQLHLDREVALKLLPEKLSADPRFAERFTREARVLAKLNHPNIVMVHDFGHAGGFYYLLMEYVEGLNLRQAMRMGKFSPGEALAIVPKICDALQFAHENGVLHRDIKPENLLLDTRGNVKIADFGIAKLLGDEKDAFTLTGTGASLGTPHYMAPEQFENPTQVDHRADIYSLGVVFYEMLTGELPLGRFTAPSEHTSLDQRIDAIVMRALARERELRQKDARELRTQVEGLATTVATNSAQPTPQSASKGWFWTHRQKLGYALASLVFLFLLVSLVVEKIEKRRRIAELQANAFAVANGSTVPDPNSPADQPSTTNVVDELRHTEAILLARERYEAAKTRHSAGVISNHELALAHRDLLVAEARGDALRIANANYELAILEFEVVRQRGDAIEIWKSESEVVKAQHAIDLAKAGTNQLARAQADLKYAERAYGAAHRLTNVRVEGENRVTTNLSSVADLQKLENAMLYAQQHYRQLQQSQPAGKENVK
jgi:serine/threonine protein kinase